MEKHTEAKAEEETSQTEEKPEETNQEELTQAQSENQENLEEPGQEELSQAHENQEDSGESCEPGPDSEEGLQDVKKLRRLSLELTDFPEFPDSLFELLCTLQEGRRLNDQRCSFAAPDSPRVRRRCHSEPNTTKPGPRVVFSSMSSLQREEFFDLVATAQARRLNDQRALLERSAPPKQKGRSFRGSIKQLTLVRRSEPAPVPKEELYSMILHTQAQGRLEDQRSRAPGPMDDEVFFSLLLRVQGGRMEEQRTELPCLLHT